MRTVAFLWRSCPHHRGHTLNKEVDLLSLDTPLRKFYITVDLTTKQEPKVLTKVDGTVLEVEVVLSQSVLTDAAEFEGVLRRVLRDGLSGVEFVPEAVAHSLMLDSSLVPSPNN